MCETFLLKILRSFFANSFLRGIERYIWWLFVPFHTCWVVARMDLPKSSRSFYIQLLVVCKIAVCDTVQCNDDVQGIRKISFIKKIGLDNWWSNAFLENRKLLEPGGYSIPASFIIFLSSSYYCKKWSYGWEILQIDKS